MTIEVGAVQETLNELMGPSRVELEVDGKPNSFTQGKFTTFRIMSLD